MKLPFGIKVAKSQVTSSSIPRSIGEDAVVIHFDSTDRSKPLKCFKMKAMVSAGAMLRDVIEETNAILSKEELDNCIVLDGGDTNWHHQMETFLENTQSFINQLGEQFNMTHLVKGTPSEPDDSESDNDDGVDPVDVNKTIPYGTAVCCHVKKRGRRVAQVTNGHTIYGVCMGLANKNRYKVALFNVMSFNQETWRIPASQLHTCNRSHLPGYVVKGAKRAGIQIA